MKKMVPHDLMRVQITKILVYSFLPAVLFLPALTLINRTASCVMSAPHSTWLGVGRGGRAGSHVAGAPRAVRYLFLSRFGLSEMSGCGAGEQALCLTDEATIS